MNKDKYAEWDGKILFGIARKPERVALKDVAGVGEGWLPILEALFDDMDRHEKQITQAPVTISDIKEKFGSLRVYTLGHDDYVDGLITMAGSMSYCTCEDCGAPGKPREGGWIRTLCDDCHKEKK